MACDSGLSPRVRGNPDHSGVATCPLSWVYPRVCGGTAVARHSVDVPPYDRSIPACAGEPSLDTLPDAALA